MSTPRLTTISFVILGLIALRGPSAPYDLERATSRSIGYFWPFPRAQLYSEPKRLASAGLLDVTVEEGRRRRQTFTLTEAGRNELNHWLEEPITEPMQIRDVAELKLFFAELTSPEAIQEIAEEQVQQHQARLQIYREMDTKYSDIEELSARMIPLKLGIRIEEAVLDFWNDIASRETASSKVLSPAWGGPQSTS